MFDMRRAMLATFREEGLLNEERNWSEHSDSVKITLVRFL